MWSEPRVLAFRVVIPALSPDQYLTFNLCTALPTLTSRTMDCAYQLDLVDNWTVVYRMLIISHQTECS